MRNKIIITSGRKYFDIDAYGGIFAYKNLLCSLGYDVLACATAKLNGSVSKVIQDLDFQFDRFFSLEEETKFIVLDVSNPDFFDTFVNLENIIEIIDHHTGYEDYWKNRKDISVQIEFIGSICTMIYEKYVERKKEYLLTENLCRILTAGILDNTLNFKSRITTDRDRLAYQKLLNIGHLEENWANIYFNSCYQVVEKNLEKSIKDDIKIEHTSNFLPDVFGQLIVLDKKIVFDHLSRVRMAFSVYQHWVFNMISLQEGISYLFCSDSEVKDKLLLVFSTQTEKDYIVLDQCLLRKEIIKIAREYDSYSMDF